MDVRELDFHLPQELIAQEPAAERSAARLLHLARDTGAITHSSVAALPEWLQAGDLLVVNNTRVFPARLLGRRVPSGGAVECLLLGRAADQTEEAGTGHERWEALMHPGHRLDAGARVVFEGAPPLHAEVLERRFYGRRLIALWTGDGSPVADAVDRAGHVPLPPYIRRADRASDRDRYQTIFARERGSVAAPTSGLHFTAPLVAALERRGVEMAEITLHVGYGTFQPVRVERVEDHRLEPERYEIGDGTAACVNRALETGRRVIAVGTTTTRALEAAAEDGRVVAGAGATGLFIFPPYRFRVIRGLMTNFHLPRSSLLILVSAFGGHAHVMNAYAAAVRERYRFFSYGDAMLIL
jgi:S-adenosylmethionine:tRNA ribosyltransferase-isomerase